MKAQQILDAATEVFLRHGFSAATTDMIQKQAGVSKATVYMCYANKEILFSAVIEQQCSKMQERIESIVVESKDLHQSLVQIGINYLNFLLSPNGLAIFRVCIAEATRFPQLSNLFYKAGPLKIAEIIAGHLESHQSKHVIELQKFGYLRSAQLLLGLIRGDIHFECLTHPNTQVSDIQIELYAKNAVTIFLNGLATPITTTSAQSIKPDFN